MATRERLSLICEVPNFANAYLGKVTKFQGYSLFHFGVLSNILAWRWKTPPQVWIGLRTGRQHWLDKLAVLDYSTLYWTTLHCYYITNGSKLNSKPVKSNCVWDLTISFPWLTIQQGLCISMRSLGLCLKITMFKVMLMCRNEAKVNT